MHRFICGILFLVGATTFTFGTLMMESIQISDKDGPREVPLAIADQIRGAACYYQKSSTCNVTDKNCGQILCGDTIVDSCPVASADTVSLSGTYYIPIRGAGNGNSALETPTNIYCCTAQPCSSSLCLKSQADNKYYCDGPAGNKFNSCGNRSQKVSTDEETECGFAANFDTDDPQLHTALVASGIFFNPFAMINQQ